MGGYNEFAAQIKDGKLRALAISSPERLPGIDIPTLRNRASMWNWSTGAPSSRRATSRPPTSRSSSTRPWARWSAARNGRHIAAERGWVDSYLPADQFAGFLQDEQTRIKTVLDELGLLKQ